MGFVRWSCKSRRTTIDVPVRLCSLSETKFREPRVVAYFVTVMLHWRCFITDHDGNAAKSPTHLYWYRVNAVLDRDTNLWIMRIDRQRTACAAHRAIQHCSAHVLIRSEKRHADDGLRSLAPVREIYLRIQQKNRPRRMRNPARLVGTVVHHLPSKSICMKHGKILELIAKSRSWKRFCRRDRRPQHGRSTD